jgi:hypothetical protein
VQSYRRHFLLSAILSVAVAACSAGSTSIRTTFEDEEYAREVYGNLLVVAVAADYNSRARFERALAAALRSATTDATGYYEIADGDNEITRDKILAAIETYGYDGVVVTRIGGRESQLSVTSGSTETKVSRREGNAVDFFRYDYEVLNEPHQVNMATTVRLITDFFDAGDARLIWTGESVVSDKRNISYRLEETARMIAARIDNDGLVAN